MLGRVSLDADTSESVGFVYPHVGGVVTNTQVGIAGKRRLK